MLNLLATMWESTWHGNWSVGGGGMMAGSTLACSAVFAIMSIIGMWMIFEKAGQKGWKALIPIYNIVILFRVAGLSGWLILLYLIPVVNIVLAFYVSIKLAEKFGKDAMYGVLIAFFAPIMYLVLGLGKAKYKKRA
ncbi:DUF5684 domain-containing protein [Candidatus Saccharibacteria bacterium]|nr:DUF5684 domain-containing protein [Candidatus Saccharibacteria bacterium]